MKTSNKLITLVLLLTLVALVAYDFLLKAEYLTGDYKIPFKNYIQLPFKNFDAVEVNASSTANVKFVQGPFSVRIEDNARDYVKVIQTDNRLKIDANFENSFRYSPNEFILVIACPKLLELITGATYHIDNIGTTDSLVPDWNIRQTSVEGFKQDSLNIIQDYGSSVTLVDNNIRTLHALVGKSEKSGSKLIIKKSNQFQAADLDIRHLSKLELENATIPGLSYQLADSAKIIISGNAQELFFHSKTNRK